MTTLRVFPRRTNMTPTDDMAFIGNPPLDLWRPQADEVHISVTFTWDIKEGERLAEAWRCYYPVVKSGGPALGDTPNEFIPGRYVKPGITFTTVGCNSKCPWCLVPEREGQLRETVDFAPGYIVQDNNLLQASRGHIERVFSMLSAQCQPACFAGGFEANRVDDWLVERLRSLRIHHIYLAADTDASLGPLERAMGKLRKLNRNQLRVYVLVGFCGEPMDKAEARLRRVWELGGLPFAQLYQPADRYIKYPQDWRNFARSWSRPAIIRAMMTKEK